MNAFLKSHNRWILAWLARLLILMGLTAGIAWLICLKFNWHGAHGFSDGLFIVGLAEIIIAGGSVWGSPIETSGSIWVRTLAGIPSKEGSIERQQTIWSDMLQKQTVAGQALICGLITMLVAVVVTLL